MPRINTVQPATSRPVLISILNASTVFTVIAEAPDYSVPDPTLRWPGDRDPADADRRIQPGQALFVTPLFIHNHDSANTHFVEMRITAQDDRVIKQARISIPPLETYTHPIAGITLTKDDLTATNGDRFEIRASSSNVIDITGTLSVGAAEQDQPG